MGKDKGAEGVNARPAGLALVSLGGLEMLGLHLDGVSWQALEEQHPALAGALQEVVKNGYSPQQIRQYVIQRGLPITWARWLEQAARFLAAAGPEG